MWSAFCSEIFQLSDSSPFCKSRPPRDSSIHRFFICTNLHNILGITNSTTKLSPLSSLLSSLTIINAAILFWVCLFYSSNFLFSPFLHWRVKVHSQNSTGQPVVFTVFAPTQNHFIFSLASLIWFHLILFPVCLTLSKIQFLKIRTLISSPHSNCIVFPSYPCPLSLTEF